jgi:hypothetical protein
MSPHATRVREIRKRVAIAAVAAFLLAFNLIAWTGSMGTTTTASSASSASVNDEPVAVTTHQS